MIWNEQDHPRDEEGKFTFKGENQTPGKILYGEKTKEEKLKKKEEMNC